MKLQDIYIPIQKEINEVERLLISALENTGYDSITNISKYMLASKGKRLRPAMVILAAKASQRPFTNERHMINIAGAMEMIHMASLIHDDIIDKASMRHNKPSVHSKWGQDISIAMGDYLYSVAFELIADCGNSDVIRCISSSTKAMCEGEFIQVCERDNLDLLKERYMVIVEKKTAALFAAACQAGTIISGGQDSLKYAFREYGINFGVAFQITDDYLDVVCDEEDLGKAPGQDINVGELTLPLLSLLESVPAEEREKLKLILTGRQDKESLKNIRSKLIDSGAAGKVKESVFSHIDAAKKRINILPDSEYKESLLSLADFVLDKGFNRLSCYQK